MSMMTETLTLSSLSSALDQTLEAVDRLASAQRLEVGAVEPKKSKLWGTTDVRVTLTGTPDGITDFETYFRDQGGGGSGNPLDFLFELPIDYVGHRLRRWRRRRRAARSAAR